MDRYGNTATPIKHVIVIIGENHTFDNVFGTYRPPAGQTVKNLLSEGIVTTSGAPGPQVSKATQQTATDTTRYQIDPRDTGAYQTLPQPNTTSVSPACDGQSAGTPDARFPGNLPNAPYQITKYVPYFDSHGQYASAGTCEFIGAFVGDPLHRFYQMYQEVSNNKNTFGPGSTRPLGTPTATRLRARSPTSRHTRARSTWASTTWRAGTPRCWTTWRATTRCPTTTTRP